MAHVYGSMPEQYYTGVQHLNWFAIKFTEVGPVTESITRNQCLVCVN